YDGLEFFWVLPGFDVQAGDPTCESSGQFSCTGTGGPGYTLPIEGDSTKADKWTVIAPVTSPGGDEVHGSQFVVALRDELEFEGTVIGQVVEGQEILESLEERVPCFGSQSSESCQTEEELPPALTIEGVEVRPASGLRRQRKGRMPASGRPACVSGLCGLGLLLFGRLGRGLLFLPLLLRLLLAFLHLFAELADAAAYGAADVADTAGPKQDHHYGEDNDKLRWPQALEN
ncbi:MAG: hypothetical protein E3J29_02685, partial [Dehalococcoidia bacterium]